METPRRSSARDFRRQRRRNARAPRRLFTQQYPQPIEDAYAAQLDKRVTAAEKLLLERLLPELKKSAEDVATAAKVAKGDGLTVVRRDQDTLEEITKRLIKVVTTTGAAFAKGASSGAKFLTAQAKAMERGATSALSRAIRRVHGINVLQDPDLNAKLLATWRRENITLIKSIDTRYFDDVAEFLGEGLKEGKTTRELTKLVEQRTAVSRGRARRIVRDQLGTLNSKITQRRQTELGITKYTWRDSGDEQVRETHEAFDGNVFTWAKGSPEGNPGEPIMCRCTADPVIPKPSSLPTTRG